MSELTKAEKFIKAQTQSLVGQYLDASKLAVKIMSDLENMRRCCEHRLTSVIPDGVEEYTECDICGEVL